jgi:hypothetical protein
VWSDAVVAGQIVRCATADTRRVGGPASVEDEDNECGEGRADVLPRNRVPIQILCSDGWYECTPMLRDFLVSRAAVALTPPPHGRRDPRLRSGVRASTYLQAATLTSTLGRLHASSPSSRW